MAERQRIDLRYDLRMSAEEEAEIMVYGHIVSRKWDEKDPDVTAKDFDQMLKDARKKGAKRLTLRINSGGGSVYQAVAMRTMLMTSGFEEIKVRIEGLCASAATLPACIPGVHVSIAEGAMYMIHNPSSGVWGNADEMEHEAQVLRKIESDAQEFYAERSGKEKSAIKALMNAETWFTAKEAVAEGFCDEIIKGAGLATACVTMEALDVMREMYSHVPGYVVAGAEPSGSPAEPEASTSSATEHITNQEGEKGMEIKDVTREQLMAENSALFEQIMHDGAAQERERLQEIDDLTPAGYEEMAAQAKQNGTSALDFHKMIVKKQREKAANHLEARKAETAPAMDVGAGAPEDVDGKDDAEMEKNFAKELAAEAAACNMYSSMF